MVAYSPSTQIQGHSLENHLRPCILGGMTKAEIRQVIKNELPDLFLEDEEIRELIIRISASRFAGKDETTDRFDRILEELRRTREEDSRRWEESRKDSEKYDRLWEESREKWEANDRRWEESRKNSEKYDRLWEESRKKWEANDQRFKEMHAETMAMFRRLDNSVTAIGARWGMKTEASFRNGLKSILEESFGVEVMQYIDRDEEGKVFGRPEQVELDIIIKDGLLIICEIKSSVSKPDIYAFIRKVDYYEEKHKRKVDRRLVISPMIDEKARKAAAEQGVECQTNVYSLGKMPPD